MSFRKGAAAVTNFPDEIFVKIRVNSERCSDLPLHVPASGVQERFVRSLEFLAQWERAGQQQPAQFTTQIGRVPLAELANVWDCTLTVRSAQVPLTDHLLINMCSKESGHLVDFKIVL
jgi:hypothetical protein